MAELYKITLTELPVSKMQVYAAIAKMNRAVTVTNTRAGLQKLDGWYSHIFAQAYKYRLHRDITSPLSKAQTLPADQV